MVLVRKGYFLIVIKLTAFGSFITKEMGLLNLFSYDFWFHITKGTEMQHLYLRLLIQYNQWNEATVLDHV